MAPKKVKESKIAKAMKKQAEGEGSVKKNPLVILDPLVSIAALTVEIIEVEHASLTPVISSTGQNRKKTLRCSSSCTSSLRGSRVVAVKIIEACKELLCNNRTKTEKRSTGGVLCRKSSRQKEVGRRVPKSCSGGTRWWADLIDYSCRDDDG
ncbi:hypothetical protein JCGZ_22435 [Jatropha curcas]|uniref:Uncharacterized protein n=1 Tax=Jatropha curcas TaxID=180498 RepID=A0A067JU09_JATCU|nr:hypothetical protein JCGZ_22435 [Jatropha curcas]